MAINVLLGTTFIDEHILPILPDKQKVVVQKYATVTIEEQHDVSAYALFIKASTLYEDIKSYFEGKRSNIEDKTLEHTSGHQEEIV